MIQTKDLSIIYENKRIDFPDIDINQGNHFLILGRSGSGKTSFLNLIGGLSSPSGGQVKINNENIAVNAEVLCRHVFLIPSIIK